MLSMLQTVLFGASQPSPADILRAQRTALARQKARQQMDIGAMQADIRREHDDAERAIAAGDVEQCKHHNLQKVRLGHNLKRLQASTRAIDSIRNSIPGYISQVTTAESVRACNEAMRKALRATEAQGLDSVMQEHHDLLTELAAGEREMEETVLSPGEHLEAEAMREAERMTRTMLNQSAERLSAMPQGLLHVPQPQTCISQASS